MKPTPPGDLLAVSDAVIALNEQQAKSEQEGTPGEQDHAAEDAAPVLRVSTLEKMNNVQHGASGDQVVAQILRNPRWTIPCRDE